MDDRSCVSRIMLFNLALLALIQCGQSNVDFRPTQTVPQIQTEDNNFEDILDSINKEIFGSLLGNLLQPPMPGKFQGPHLLRLYCENRRIVRINLEKGFSNVYCIFDRVFLNTVMLYSLPKEGLEGEEKKKTGWYAADKVLQRYGYVPICARHCPEGTRPELPSGKYTRPMHDTYFSVGCQELFTSSCADVCTDEIYDVDNGKVVCTLDTQVGTVCTLECNKDHVAVGPVSQTCKSTRKWNETEPFRCLPTDVGNVIKTEMELEGLSFDEAMSQLRSKLQKFLDEKNPSGQSNHQENGGDVEDEPAEGDMIKILQGFLAKLSETATVTLKRFSECAVAPRERRDCGWPGITKEQCKSRGCCWDSKILNTYWCFVAPMNYTTKTTTKYPYPINMPTLQNNPLNFQGNLQHPIPTLQELLSPSNPHPQHDFKDQGPTSPLKIPSPCEKEEKCGCVTRQVSRCLLTPWTRVFNGIDTIAEHWPWHAIVFHGKSLCGGTLISRNYVLTAAHCLILGDGVTDKDPDNKIYLGVSSRTNVDKAVQTRQMKRIIRHPLFYSKGSNHVQNDIALIQLSEPAIITDSVRTLCLPGKSRPKVNSVCAITGFGKTAADADTASMTLQSAKLPIAPPDQCSGIFNSFNPVQNLCAGSYSANSADACKGDSGGPLACQAIEGDKCSWYLAGVTSFGNEPCGGGSPGVYVNVSHYEDWILSHIRPYHGK